MPNVISSNDVFDFDELLEWTKVEKPAEFIKFDDDPLALAVSSYRHWRAGGSRWIELTEVTATDDDRRIAEDIKSYYRERMVFEALKKNSSSATSEFRQKLAKLVNNELGITKKEIGLLLRLPYFYDEDRAVDNIVAQTQTVDNWLRGAEVVAKFTLRQRVLRSRSTGDYYDYWMTSDHSPAAYRFVMRHDNNLRQFIESFIERPVEAKVSVYTQRMRGYWQGRTCQQIIFTGMV